jgi:hypothetical protein
MYRKNVPFQSSLSITEASKKQAARLCFLNARRQRRDNFTSFHMKTYMRFRAHLGRCCPQIVFFPLGFLLTILYAFLISSVLVPLPSHHIIGLAIPITFFA